MAEICMSIDFEKKAGQTLGAGAATYRSSSNRKGCIYVGYVIGGVIINRGIIEERMTRDQIAEAQALARRCMSSDYQDCD